MSITIYSKPNCVQCSMTKKRMDALRVDYTVVDLTEDDAALAYVQDTLGYLSAPVVVTDEGEHWGGFRPDRIKSVAASVAA